MNDIPFAIRALRRLLLISAQVPGVKRLAGRVYIRVARRIAERLARCPSVWAVDVRGSTVTANVNPGRSDIDLHVLLEGQPAAKELAALRPIAREYGRLRQQESLLRHLTVMSRGDKEAGIVVAAPRAVGQGERSLRLAGPSAPAELAVAQRRKDPFLDLWFSLLQVFQFFPRVALSPTGTRRPVHEHYGTLERVLACNAALLSAQEEHPAVNRYRVRWQRRSARRAWWVRSPERDDFESWTDLLAFFSDVARTLRDDDFAGLLQTPLTGQAWQWLTDPELQSAESWGQLDDLREVALRHGATDVRVTSCPWQHGDRRCFVILPEPVEAEQVAILAGAVRESLERRPLADARSFSLPIFVTEALFALGFAFPKAPLDTIAGGQPPTLCERESWLTSHAVQIEIVRQVEMLRSKAVESLAGDDGPGARFQDWLIAFFPAARLFTETETLCDSPRIAVERYLSTYDDATCPAIETHARNGAAEPAQRADLGIDELYLALHPIAVSLAERLSNAERRVAADF